jgi:hypothetical protein
MSSKAAVVPAFDILSPNDFYGVIRTIAIAQNSCLEKIRAHLQLPNALNKFIKPNPSAGNLAFFVNCEVLVQAAAAEPKQSRKKRKTSDDQSIHKVWPMLVGMIVHGMRRRAGCHNGFIVNLMLKLTKGARATSSSGSLSRHILVQMGVRRVFGERLQGFMMKCVREGLKRMQMSQPLCFLMSTLQVMIMTMACILHSLRRNFELECMHKHRIRERLHR